MPKKLYLTLITLAFGTLSIPTVLSIILQRSLLPDFINSASIKSILIFFICVIEADYIEKTIPKIIGWLLPFVLLVGILFKILHWPWANELIISSGVAILINLTTMALIEKNKGLFHYLLFLFVFQRLLIIVWNRNELLWWIDVIICFAITLVGIGKIVNLNFKRNINNVNS